VHVPYGANTLPDAVSWDALVGEPGELAFEPVPFAHPLAVLFSSGTTGKPKAIIHGHGGILLEHLKNHALSWDLGPGDRILWFSTTAWMMWNALVSALLVRASIVMIDGNPLHPDIRWQWRLAEETGATLMGASPGFLMACRKEGVEPAKEFDLSRLRQIGAAGSPLPPEGYRWVAEQFGPDVLLNVGSGGTDICSGIVQGSPLQPVWAGEISGPCLGIDAKAFDDKGEQVVGELGELVITAPLPSMPVGFWGDPDGTRYRDTYFDVYPGVWRHGDWVRFSEVGSAIIAGRSDATLNRGGVRLGTAEFYRVVEELPEIADSLVVHLEDPAGGNGQLLLFVRPADGVELDDALRRRISTTLRTELSPRHIPDRIAAVPVIPHNRTGKKLELPVKKILLGAAPDEVASRDVLADPTALDAFVELRGAS
jgi:acetoacetyl-CoA synthetase